MPIGNTEPIAPRAIVIPNAIEQNISGAMFISGAELYFFPYDGSAKLKLVSSTAI